MFWSAACVTCFVSSFSSTAQTNETCVLIGPVCSNVLCVENDRNTVFESEARVLVGPEAKQATALASTTADVFDEARDTIFKGLTFNVPAPVHWCRGGRGAQCLCEYSECPH